MNAREILLKNLGAELNFIFKNVDKNIFNELREIRIRIGKPLAINLDGKEIFLDCNGKLCNHYAEAFFPDASCIAATIELMSNYSLYAFEEEIRNGFLTLEGGHRVGVSGKAIVENQNLKTIRNINALNIRVSHEVKGCADSVINLIAKPNLQHTLIISPPCCGKTTLLRDIARQISDGFSDLCGQAVGIVDERSEIAGCYKGIPQNDVGIRSDVLDCCPKEEGMRMLLRAMSPKVIVVDEIGKHSEIYAIEDIINAGIKLICTVHGSSIEDIRRKPVLSELLSKNIFTRFVVLESRKKIGTIMGVYDEQGRQLCI